MPARLIAISQFMLPGVTVGTHDAPTAEDLIVYCARVSNPKNQTNFGTGSRLLKYCIDHGHWSVFEMASMCVEVVTSRAIGRQIIRHRSFSFQEFSQRYAPVQADTMPVQFRLQGKGRQGGDLDANLPDELQEQVEDYLYEGMVLYDKLLKHGVAYESARFLLPELTETTMYINGTIRSWLHYLQQRCSPHTQREHRELAQSILQIFSEQFPRVSVAMGWKEEE